MTEFKEGDQVWGLVRLQRDAPPLLDIIKGTVTMTDVSEGQTVVFLDIGKFQATPMLSQFCRHSEVECLDLLLAVSDLNMQHRVKAVAELVTKDAPWEVIAQEKRILDVWAAQKQIAVMLRAGYDVEHPGVGNVVGIRKKQGRSRKKGR